MERVGYSIERELVRLDDEDIKDDASVCLTQLCTTVVRESRERKQRGQMNLYSGPIITDVLDACLRLNRVDLLPDLVQAINCPLSDTELRYIGTAIRRYGVSTMQRS